MSPLSFQKIETPFVNQSIEPQPFENMRELDDYGKMFSLNVLRYGVLLLYTFLRCTVSIQQ